MAKARCNFIYRVDKNNRYHQDGKDKLFKKGDVIPSGIVPRIAYHNPEFIEGIIDEKERDKVVAIALKKTRTEVEEKKIKPKKIPTKSEIKSWNKEKQIDELQKFGITGSQIRLKYKYEEQRVNKLYYEYSKEL